MSVIIGYLLIIFIIALVRKQDSLTSFITGATNGVATALKLLPTIMGLVFAINVFVKSGIIDILSGFINNPVIVAELILQALFRPISANSSLVIMDLIYQKYQPNSLTGQISSLIQGSSDTTLYVITVYYGSLKITKTKYVVVVGLLTDLITFILAIVLGILILSP